MSRSQSCLTLVAVAGWMIAATMGAMYGLLVSSMTCDDWCSAPPYSRWQENSEAWQWDALALLTLAGWLAALVGGGLMASSNPRRGRPVIAGSLLCALAWLALAYF